MIRRDIMIPKGLLDKIEDIRDGKVTDIEELKKTFRKVRRFYYAYSCARRRMLIEAKMLYRKIKMIDREADI